MTLLKIGHTLMKVALSVAITILMKANIKYYTVIRLVLTDIILVLFFIDLLFKMYCIKKAHMHFPFLTISDKDNAFF